MPLTAITATLVAIYLGIGTMDSWCNARDIAQADPEKLCSDACRRWKRIGHTTAVRLTSHPLALITHLIGGVQWPRVMFKRCRCFREAAKVDS